jgi:hypothetical protein
MKIFKVLVTRYYFTNNIFIVDAETEDEARVQAEEMEDPALSSEMEYEDCASLIVD